MSSGGASGFTGLIARGSGCQRDSLLRFFQKMFDDWDHFLWFGRQRVVAGVRDHGELGIRDEPEARNGVLHADKVVISDGDENGRLDRS